MLHRITRLGGRTIGLWKYEDLTSCRSNSTNAAAAIAVANAPCDTSALHATVSTPEPLAHCWLPLATRRVAERTTSNCRRKPSNGAEYSALLPPSAQDSTNLARSHSSSCHFIVPSRWSAAAAHGGSADGTPAVTAAALHESSCSRTLDGEFDGMIGSSSASSVLAARPMNLTSSGILVIIAY